MSTKVVFKMIYSMDMAKKNFKMDLCTRDSFLKGKNMDTENILIKMDQCIKDFGIKINLMVKEHMFG